MTFLCFKADLPVWATSDLTQVSKKCAMSTKKQKFLFAGRDFFWILLSFLGEKRSKPLSVIAFFRLELYCFDYASSVPCIACSTNSQGLDTAVYIRICNLKLFCLSRNGFEELLILISERTPEPRIFVPFARGKSIHSLLIAMIEDRYPPQLAGKLHPPRSRPSLRGMVSTAQWPEISMSFSSLAWKQGQKSWIIGIY